MNGTTPNSSPPADSAAITSPLWDDYGYHHDDLVEPTSIVPVQRGPRGGHSREE